MKSTNSSWSTKLTIWNYKNREQWRSFYHSKWQILQKNKFVYCLHEKFRFFHLRQYFFPLTLQIYAPEISYNVSSLNHLSDNFAFPL